MDEMRQKIISAGIVFIIVVAVVTGFLYLTGRSQHYVPQYTTNITIGYAPASVFTGQQWDADIVLLSNFTELTQEQRTACENGAFVCDPLPNNLLMLRRRADSPCERLDIGKEMLCMRNATGVGMRVRNNALELWNPAAVDGEMIDVGPTTCKVSYHSALSAAFLPTGESCPVIARVQI